MSLDGHLFGSSHHADSAGQAWAGRSFEPNAFAGDDGSAPEVFVHAVTAWVDAVDMAEAERASDAERGAPIHLADARDRAFADLVALIPYTRFLIPLVAEAGNEGLTESGLRVDKTQDLSVVTVAGPQGEPVLPIFTSVAAMTTWRADARPVPAEGTRCVAAAIRDGSHWIVIDPGNESSFIVRRPVLAALAVETSWMPPALDPVVRERIGAALEGVAEVVSVKLETGDPRATGLNHDLVVQLILVPGLTQNALSSLVGTLAETWSQDEALNARVESLRIALSS